MVVQHEHQHDETLLATLQLMDDFAHPAADGDAGDPCPRRAARVDLPADVLVVAGEHVLGTDTDPWAYDNERPAHVVELDAFRIDTTPVTNAAYARFVDAGGYDDPASWTEEGWAWRTEAGLAAPQFWTPRHRRRVGPPAVRTHRTGPAHEPVQHVCWYEADAYARWAGARLPTEAEWEAAAHGTPLAAPISGATGRAGSHRRRSAPGRRGESAPGARADARRGVGVDRVRLPARTRASGPFPYREYSEVFFGPEYKVLRGGSWATHPSAVRTTFRNWDFPIRRQIFAGFRCARDA